MLNRMVFAAAAAAVLVLAGCKRDKAADAMPDAAAAVEQAANAKPAPEQGEAAAAEKTQPAGFDLSALPVSTVALGDFPYIAFPANCAQAMPETLDFKKAPFWVGDHFQWVEGKTFVSYVQGKNGAACGFDAFVHNLDAVVAQAGGSKINVGKLTRAGWQELVDSGVLNGPLETGLQQIQNNPVATWVIRRQDRAIWIQAVSSFTTNADNFMVLETEPLAITASLLPASQLKQQLDSAGKVALQVNFATDKTDILPASQPQIAQVVELMKIDGALKLDINGHTDNTGDAAHNQALSEGRAKAVVAALVAQGIDASRLSAKGFGDSQPVADNGTEEGKAKNRRVELVKR